MDRFDCNDLDRAFIRSWEEDLGRVFINCLAEREPW